MESRHVTPSSKSSSSPPTLPSPSTSNGSLLSILKYADKYDRALMVLGFLGAVGDGISLPATMLLMSGLIDAFGKSSTSMSSSQFMDEITKYCLYFVYVGLADLAACFLEAAAWIKTGERQASRLRTLYLKAILRQDEGFFDMQGADTAEVVNSVAEDTLTIQEVVCEKVPHFTMHLSTFVASYVVGFHLASQLAAVSLAFLPLLIIPGLMYGRILAGLSKEIHAEYLKAGSVAEQALSSIRTVYSFVGESTTMRQFSDKLDGTVKLGLKQGLAKGLAVGSNGLTFAIWAFMAWYGSHLVMYHGYNGGRVVATGLSALLGGLALGSALPNLKYFSEASVAASHILKMIHRVPDIDPDDDSGKILETVFGQVEFRNVRFVYPARPCNTIFENLSLVIPAGKTMALVGGSGSGKSTVVALMERFYDPLAGEILLDGINIKLIQLKSMRQQIGLVSQEPALFATSIRENILLAKEDATMEDVIAAAKKANAHNFISQLPDAYETQVGERGVQMSGGQKQRIAIARAMLKDPPLLLLDEATSALDAESERVVQEALDTAALGRTTVVVAHRLTTIRNADCIAVLEGGEVRELGQHEELLQRGGHYAMLVSAAIGHDVVTMGEEEERRSSIMRVSSSSLRSRPSSTSRPSFNGCGRSGQLGGEDHASEAQEQANPPSFRRLVALNKPEWRQATLGSLGAAGFGVIQPLYAFTLGSMITAFYLKDHAQQSQRILKYSLSFAALAVASFLTNAVQHYNFAAMGEHLTKRVRERMLRNILTFEVGWFDEVENSSGAICGRLASGASVVRSLVGDRWSLIVTTFVAVVAAWSFGLVISWRLAIVIIAVQPLVILCFYTRRVLIKKMSDQALHMQQHSSHLAAEAVAHHRTIAAFSSQSIVIRLFDDLQEQSRSAATRQALIGGLGLGAAQITMFLSWALDFWYGGYLLNKGHLTPSAMFKTFFILVSTGRVIADAGSMTTDIAKGAAAVASVFGILDRISRINPDDPEALTLDSVKGGLELRHVDFAYPSRPDIMVFRNFNLRVRAGQCVALVGHSGSGKSTVIGLIERFYDPLKGAVKIDGVDIRKLHLRWLRRHVALVGQEPTLFAGTIRENILYGKEDATETEVVEAAKAANAHDFVSALGDGYETSVGERGVQLSGGQKQRIAIARAIIKAPAILLLDEATSALDAQSEKVVQDALDGVMVGRTTLVVAHRLSTIHNCDSIAVVQDGTVVESGNHADLLANAPTGAYFNLVKLQQPSSSNYSTTTSITAAPPLPPASSAPDS